MFAVDHRADSREIVGVNVCVRVSVSLPFSRTLCPLTSSPHCRRGGSEDGQVSCEMCLIFVTERHVSSAHSESDNWPTSRDGSMLVEHLQNG